MTSRLLVAGLLLITALGCTTSSGGSREPGRDRNVLTSEEMATMESFTAWDAVQRLRPMWMRPGGIRNSANPAGHFPHVFVDGAPYGPMETLRGFRVVNIETMRYISPTDATIRYGGQYQGGVILVNIKGQA